MADATVFYSWQSDLDQEVTRYFVRDCLKQALKTVGSQLACDLEPDEDTRGEQGSPRFSEVIPQKIRKAVAFVADLSIVALRPKGGGLTNGCVGIEWGWAEEALGAAALIGVINEHFGDLNQLPVDIRQNRVQCRFTLAPAADSAAKKQARADLTAQLERALHGAMRERCFKTLHSEAPKLVAWLAKDSGASGLAFSYPLASLPEKTGLSLEAAKAVVADLCRLELATTKGGLGDRSEIEVLPGFYSRYDPLFMGWNAQHDATTIAKKGVEGHPTQVTALAASLGWGPRRINPALDMLRRHALVDPSPALPNSYFLYSGFRLNHNTQAFAEGRLRIPGGLYPQP